jgi:L-iditol 2-dehydrogenase
MLALVYRGPGAVELEEWPEPKAAEGEVVLQVDACAICGTDLRIAAGNHRAFANGTGRIPGHEVVGSVVEAGRGSLAHVGQTVFVAPNYGCRKCRPCRQGQVNLCERLRAIGITDNGGFAERLLLPAELVGQGNLVPLAEGADPALYALAEPLACALRGAAACRVGPEDSVLIFGAGPIGLFHVALARAAGAGPVIVADPHAERRRVALAWGAALATGTEPAEVRDALSTVGMTSGVDAVVVAAPSPSAQALALELARAGGRVNFFAGLARDRSRVEIDTSYIHYKELLVTGTTGSTNEACRSAVKLIADGTVDAASLVGARLPLSSVREAFSLAGSGQVMKVVVEP